MIAPSSKNTCPSCKRISIPINSPTFFFYDTATTEIYTLSLHDALPISGRAPPGSWGWLSCSSSSRCSSGSVSSGALANPSQELALEGQDLVHHLLRRLEDSVEPCVDDGWVVATGRHRAKLVLEAPTGLAVPP